MSKSKQDSRALKIKILLGIDITFFLIELVSGVLLSSLALLSDSFHVFNDVLSLFVALYALRLASSENSAPSPTYSYGWQRAEVLGALVNGVFLLALCVSVGLEAISRLFGDVEISSPIVMVYVGSAGLLSNIVGLFLFHDHGHSHGGHSHGPKKDAESHGSHERTPLISSEAAIHEHEHEEELEAEEELFVHPGEFRGNIVRAAQDAGYGSTSQSHGHSHGNGHAGHGYGDEEEEEGHGHSHGGKSGGHGHSHEGSMNMQGVFLHVLGDALGNVGVILAGVVITWTEWKYRMYADPFVSLVITFIIFAGALPLVKSASFILLQGVPSSVPLELVRKEIAGVEGVLNVHELHIWSLSESKTVCSVHVMTNGKSFVDVCRDIRIVLHKYGIHSSTIQPEVVENKATAATVALAEDQDGCLVSCIDESCRESACCPPGTSNVTPEG